MMTFTEFVATGTSVVLFCSPSVARCAQLQAELRAAAQMAAIAKFSLVDAKRHGGIARIFSVTPPAFLVFRDGAVVERYLGSKVSVDLAKYADAIAKSTKLAAPVSSAAAQSDLVLRLSADERDTRAFDDLLGVSPTVLVAFLTHDCSHCRRLRPQLKVASELLKREHSRGRIAEIECDSVLGKEICGQFELTSFPALILFSKRAMKHLYVGARSGEALAEEVRQNSWRTEL
jgi:thioredoxin-like negative regulator of GroEL